MDLTLSNSVGERLDYTFHAALSSDSPNADGGASSDLVILGHGVTGNKDRPFAVALAEQLAQSGIPALRLSFSGNGESQGRFEDSTISKEVGDLSAVLDQLSRAHPELRLSYAGHSMGAAVGVQCAARDPRITHLVSLAGMVHTANFARIKFGELTPGSDCMWEKPECPLSQAYMDDLAQIDSVVNFAEQISVPWLLVHGTNDSVVPLQDSRDIYERAAGPKQLIELEGSDHVFSPPALNDMAEVTAKWLTEQLLG